jgi:hypothetical protein
MRLYIKLTILIALSVAIQRSLPEAVELSSEASFTLRCGIARWTGDRELEARLVDEAHAKLIRTPYRAVAAAGGR